LLSTLLPLFRGHRAHHHLPLALPPGNITSWAEEFMHPSMLHGVVEVCGLQPWVP